MAKRLLLALLACSALWLAAAAAGPADLNSRLEEEKTKLRVAMEAEQSLLRQLYGFDQQRYRQEVELRRVAGELSRVRRTIEADRATVEEMERDLPRRRARVGRQLASLYRMGRGGFWKLLLTSESYQTFNRRYRAIKRVIWLDAEALTAYRERLVEIQERRGVLQARQTELLALNEREQAAALEIEVEKGKKLYLLAEIRRDKTAAARLAQELAGRDIQVGQTLATLPREPLPPDPLAHLDFRQRQGKLPSPVVGPIVGHFGTQVNEEFGTQTRSNGIDIATILDSPVRAVAPGVVRYIGNLGYGRVLIVDHGARYHTLYGHLADFRRTPGDMVQTGDVIGTVGASGLYREPVLHFEIRYQGVAVNPMPWLAMTDH